MFHEWTESAPWSVYCFCTEDAFISGKKFTSTSVFESAVKLLVSYTPCHIALDIICVNHAFVRVAYLCA